MQTYGNTLFKFKENIALVLIAICETYFLIKKEEGFHSITSYFNLKSKI